MDSHNIGRGRDGAEKALSQIKSKVLAIGVDTDVLFTPSESQFVSKHVANGTYREISSIYGHDAFLIEFGQLNYILKSFYLEGGV